MVNLYNQFRPINFDEVRGQEVAVRIIRNQSKNLTAHSFIFTGMHGTGKTTIAKIFGRALNCESLEDGNPCNVCESCKSYFNGTNFDVVEIDGASNNSVDDIRRIQDQLVYPPQRKRKVYIIDEVHMLSTSAFNALLKTIEEPPKHAVFVLCTTEVNKLPKTIRSRCVEIHFQSIPLDEIFNNLLDICQIKGVAFEKEGLKLIAQIASGSMRDALSMLEKCLSYGELTYQNISDVLGVVDMHTVISIVRSLIAKDIPAALQKVNNLHSKGKDFLQLTADLIRVFRNLMVLQSTDDPSLFDMDVSELKEIPLKERECFEVINILSELLTNLKYSDSPKVLMEVYLMQISSMLTGNAEMKGAEVSQRSKSDKEEVDHNDYLTCKIDLIKSYSMEDKELTALLDSQIFTRKDAFLIRTTHILDKEGIKRRLKDITGKNLNVKIVPATKK